MKKRFPNDGKSRPSSDLYRKNFDEIFGNKPEMDLKGTIFCKSKNCNNHLYKNESPDLKGYCLDCG